jgi:hypothetical protein
VLPESLEKCPSLAGMLLFSQADYQLTQALRRQPNLTCFDDERREALF